MCSYQQIPDILLLPRPAGSQLLPLFLQKQLAVCNRHVQSNPAQEILVNSGFLACSWIPRSASSTDTSWLLSGS